MPKLVTPNSGETPEEKDAREGEEEAAEAIRQAAPRETCPFLGVMHMISGRQTSPAEQMRGAPPIASAIQGVMVPCLHEKCAFWNGEATMPCAIRGGLEAMIRVDAARRAAPLGGVAR